MKSRSRSPFSTFTRHALTLTLLLTGTGLASAAVQLASPFTSHMVLQRELPMPVWGRADAGEVVTVEFAGQIKTVTADAAGQWRIDLAPLAASTESRVLTVSGASSATPVRLDDVLVGEVWLCSGQSNMVFTLSKSVYSWAGVVDEAKEIAAAQYPQIRMFTAAATKANTPQTTVGGEWLVCSPANAPGFSAIGYFFARELQRELKVPVGIVAVSYGASCAQAWIRREAISARPELKAILDQFDAAVKNYVPPTAAELKDWQTAVDQAKAEGKKAPRHPRPDPVQDQHNPTVMFNGMLAPIVPFAVRGVLWYQGESITGPKELFPLWNETLITDWRKLWGRELPFFFCQLAALDNASNNPEVRALQAEALKLSHTAMAVTIDVGDRKNVHPQNKAPVGDRLARIALAKVYGKTLEYSGPQFAGLTIEAGVVRVKFTHAEGGLVAKDGPLKTLEIAGADLNFVPAEAQIDGDTLLVRSAVVAQPVAVRYAWTNYPEGCNLTNTAGLPAAPFRTGTK